MVGLETVAVDVRDWQAMLGDLGNAVGQAVMESSDAHQNQLTQYLNSKELDAKFRRVIFDMLLSKTA